MDRHVRQMDREVRPPQPSIQSVHLVLRVEVGAALSMKTLQDLQLATGRRFEQKHVVGHGDVTAMYVLL